MTAVFLPHTAIKSPMKMIADAQSRGFECLEWRGSHHKSGWKCPKGHEFQKRASLLRRSGYSCPMCWKVRNVNKEGFRPQPSAQGQATSVITSAGYTIVSEYRSSIIKLDLICDRGHPCQISWHNFSQGTRCKICKFDKQKVKNKSSGYQKILEVARREGLEVLTGPEGYLDTRSRISFRDSEGKVLESCWVNISANGGRVRKKVPKKRTNANPEAIRRFLLDRGVEPLGDISGILRPIRAMTKVGERTFYWGEWKRFGNAPELTCPAGHNYIRRCASCDLTRLEGRFRTLAESRGFEYLGFTYESGGHRLSLRCPNHHATYVQSSEFRRGQGCRECIRRQPQEFIDYARTIGYEVLEIPASFTAATKCSVRCDRGHVYMTSFNYMRNYSRCSVCFNSQSVQEKEIGDRLEVLGYKVERRVRLPVVQGSPWYRSKTFELDILLPERSLAIEFNGLYWHSGNPSEQRVREGARFKLVNSALNGVDLITVFEDEYMADPDLVMSKILARLDPGYRCTSNLIDLRYDKVPDGATVLEETPPRMFGTNGKKRFHYTEGDRAIFDCGHISLGSGLFWTQKRHGRRGK